MMGWIGDELEDLAPHLFMDADFAGCPDTSRATTGVQLMLKGPNSCFPMSSTSKRQGAVSHSTPEAEVVAGCYALRTTGIPVLGLWQILLNRAV